MPRLSRWILALSVLVAVPVAAQQASSPTFGAEAGVVYVTLSGDDFEDTDAGLGFMVAGLARFTRMFALALGFQLSSHDDQFLDESITATQFYVEPRVLIGMDSPTIQPYIAARLGLARRSATVEGEDISGGGTAFGVLGGLAFGGSGAVRFVVDAGWHSVNFDDVEVDGQTIQGTEASGSAIVLRGGVQIMFGGGSSAMNALRRR